MNKHIVFFLFALLPSFQGWAMPGNNSLKGAIKDMQGHTLPGAIIEIPDLKTGTVADSNGKYEISNLPKGKFIVVASLISFAKATLPVNINGVTQQDFVLNESAIESKEVVITGQSKATEINRSPVPVVAINNKYLKENISSNVIDAIAKVPGVCEVTTGPNISKPFIRGLGYNRVLTLYNGMRQEGQQWGDEHGIEVDEFGIDRVELVKGPASLIYGSDAIAGVVNLIPAPPPPDGKISGNLTTEYQGNNKLMGASGIMAGSQNSIYWQGRVSHKQAIDYQNAIDGRVYGTNFNETDANASFGLNRKWGSTHLDLSMYHDLQAVPDGSRDSASRKFTKMITEADSVRPIVSNDELNSYRLPALHQEVLHYRAMSSNKFNLSSGLLTLNAGFERSVRQEFSHPQDADVPGLFLQMNSYLYDVKYYFHQIKGWDFTAGINGMYQTNDVTKGTEFVIPSYRQFDFGPFIMLKKNIKKLDIVGGIRYDSRTFHNDALYSKPDPATGFDSYVSGNTAGAQQLFNTYDHTFSGVTYSLGLTYIFSKHLAAKANMARGFRAPNISELSANGVHPGTNIYQLGNPGFKPEFSLQGDLGLEFTTEHLSANVAVFNNSITNYIFNQKVLTSRGLDSFSGVNQVYQFTETNARLYGGEASIDIHPHPLDWLHFENSLSVVYAVNEGINGVAPRAGEKYLPFIPPVHGISELRADIKHAGKYFQNSFIKVQLAAYAAQDRIFSANNTETVTAAYHLLNAGLGTEIVNRSGKALLNISIFGDNLLDASYQDHLNRLKYFEPYPNDPRGHPGIFNMGRNIGVKVSVPLNVR